MLSCFSVVVIYLPIIIHQTLIKMNNHGYSTEQHWQIILELNHMLFTPLASVIHTNVLVTMLPRHCCNICMQRVHIIPFSKGKKVSVFTQYKCRTITVTDCETKAYWKVNRTCIRRKSVKSCTAGATVSKHSNQEVTRRHAWEGLRHYCDPKACTYLICHVSFPLSNIADLTNLTCSKWLL